MNTDQEVLYRCFEEVANSGIDLAPVIYDKFTASMPQVSQHISYMDSRMRGRMLDQVYNLLLGEIDSNYLAFETEMHRGYGADTALYRGLLTSVKTAMKEAQADIWAPEADAAWDRTIERIVSDIEQLESTSSTS